MQHIPKQLIISFISGELAARSDSRAYRWEIGATVGEAGCRTKQGACFDRQ